MYLKNKEKKSDANLMKYVFNSVGQMIQEILHWSSCVLHQVNAIHVLNCLSYVFICVWHYIHN